MQIQKPRHGYKLVKSLFGKYEEIPEEWNCTKMKDVCKKISVGIATSTTKYFVDKGVPLLRNQNIKEGYIETDDLQYISKEFAKMNQSKKLQEGDVVCMRTGYPGQSAVVPAEMNGWQTFTTLIVRPNHEILSSPYLSIFLNSNGRKQITSVQAGAAQQNLNAGWLSNMFILIPPLKEQQKIALILSNVDSLINQTQKIIEQTQKLKKGMMQQLLTKGIGHTKFKKTKLGEIPEEWQISSLSKLCKVRSENQIDSTLYIGLEHIGQGSNSLVGKGNVKEFTSTKNVFRKGDILYGKLRPLLNKVWLSEYDGYCSTDILPLVTNDLLVNKLLEKTLSSERFVSFADSTSAGTKMPRTNWSDIGKFELAVPPIKEQQKISSIISYFDHLIKNQQQYKSKLETFKKGIMQKLLTGQIRVKV